ncbi:MAG TPA: hypothetical protein VEX68_28275 [Bryobacteraceae bacterium]|nr:hypothetical protein [Bryobacteraceae bacterium]
MLSKNDFSPADWNTIRELPPLVGFATLLSGSSGLGTVKESMAIAQQILEGQSSDLGFIRDLSNRTEMQAAQTSIREMLSGLGAELSSDRMKSLTLERVANGLSVLGSKASADEVSQYRQWLYTIAENVAKAAKEGGFLGFGGTQVSEGEQKFLNELRTALQITAKTT